MLDQLYKWFRAYFGRVPGWRHVPPPNWRSARKRTDGVYW